MHSHDCSLGFVNGNTRLSEALAAHPDVLEYIISLNPHDFNRLHNPLLRKVMPPRITLGRIAKMVGISTKDLVEKIHQIAGINEKYKKVAEAEVELPVSAKEPPEWLWKADPDSIKWVDVLPIDEVSGDPMPPINIAVNQSEHGQIVGIKHKWEPQPLYDIWHQRGFEFWSHQESPEEWHIFVYRPIVFN